MYRRALAEGLATFAALAAAWLAYELHDPTSRTRLWLAARSDDLRDWSIRQRVETLISSTVGKGEP